MKLQLFISHNGGVSRRKAFDHVINGDVTVNDNVVLEPSHMIEPGEDKVTLLGREIKLTEYQYIMLNKPSGYVTTCEAQFDQTAVMSLLPPNLRHLKPVGRLDKDTQGLLLLTNDGELANRLAHPSFDVNKTYHVCVARKMEYREKDRLEQGVVIDGFRTAPAEVSNINYFGTTSTEFDLTIHEGHKHQVRLMCHEVGHDVERLTRIAQGPLKLGELKVGTWRPLTGEELAELHAIGRTNIAPVFKSHAPQRRYSANRDWSSDRPEGQKYSTPANSRAEEQRSERFEGRPSGERREYRPFNRDERPRTDRPRSDRPYSSDRPRSDRPRSDRPYASGPRADRPRGDRPYSSSPREGRSSGGRRDERPGTAATGPRSFGANKPFGKKPFNKKPFGKKPFAR